MPILQTLKLLQALFLFLKEMWLRDRTFRQFVRENLSFILISIGFAMMTILFVNMYIIVKDQESTIAISKQTLKHSQQQLDTLQNQLKEAKDTAEWWKGQYETLRAQTAKVMVNKPSPANTKKTVKRAPTNRPPPSTLVDRWMQLHR